MQWYALFVIAGGEELVCKGINILINKYNRRDITYRYFVPKRKLLEYKDGIETETLKLMFPGYVLLQTNCIFFFKKLTEICSAFINIVKFDEIMPGKVYPQEVNQLLKLADENGIINISDIIIEKDHIIVVKGALLNYYGKIKKINKRKRRIKVFIHFNNNEYYIDFGINIINKEDYPDLSCFRKIKFYNYLS